MALHSRARFAGRQVHVGRFVSPPAAFLDPKRRCEALSSGFYLGRRVADPLAWRWPS